MSYQVTNLGELRDAIETARWFKNLGKFNDQSRGIPVSRALWLALTSELRHSEFGTPVDDPDRGVPDLADWLPASIYSTEFSRAGELSALIAERDAAAEVRKARLSISKLALRSLRGMHHHELLRVGASNFTEVAKGAARFACWAAATELVLRTPGFWVELIPIYAEGNWPFGSTRTGEKLVL